MKLTEPQRAKLSAIGDGLVYHGTPMTPRAALNAVMPGRAACVSFWRPDDVEAVEAICPYVMFRQRRVFGMESGDEARGALVHSRGLDTLFRLAGTQVVHAGPMGSDTGCTGRAFPAQRQPVAAMAVRGSRRAIVAHGRADRATVAAVRQIPPCLSRMDRQGQVARQSRVSRTDGRGCACFGQSLANAAHDARACGVADVSVCERGRNNSSAERMAI